MKFMFGLQHPLTCKPWTTLSNPCNKVRGKYVVKEFFLRLSACVCLIMVSLWCCMNMYMYISIFIMWVYNTNPSHTQTFQIKWEVYFSKNCVARRLYCARRYYCVVVCLARTKYNTEKFCMAISVGDLASSFLILNYSNKIKLLSVEISPIAQ